RVPRELARQIAYVHRNPVEAKIVAEPVHFTWSSARAFLGLSRAPLVNVARALTLMAHERWRVVKRVAVLTDLEPVPYPTVGVDLVVAAAAQAYGLVPS